MPTTKRTPARSSKDRRDETLIQFSAAVDIHLGRPVGFANAVAELADARARIKRIENRRLETYRELERRHTVRGGGVLIIPAVGGLSPRVVRRTPAVASAVRTVPAEVVKKADPAAYERAKVPKAKLRLVAPASWPGTGAVDKLPAAANPHHALDQVVSLYQSKLFSKLSDLREVESDARTRLDKIAADAGWDGGEENGPLLFADGWEIGLRTREYNADRLRTNDPALFDSLAVVRERVGGTRLVVMDLDQAMAMGYVDDDALELDEIDGD